MLKAIDSFQYIDIYGGNKRVCGSHLGFHFAESDHFGLRWARVASRAGTAGRHNCGSGGILMDVSKLVRAVGIE